MGEAHRTSRSRFLRFTAIADAVILVAATASALVIGIDSEVSYPDAWDDRVVDLVGFVESARGHDFKHPVHVHFLTAEEYTAEVTENPEDFSEQELEELDQVTAIFRAVGLVEGDFDPMEAFNDLSDEGTLAFYVPDEKRIVVRGTELDPGIRVTLVHELTHALQDQHFNLEQLDDFEDSDAALAFRGLVEGDAQRIENAYLEELSEEERTTYEAANDSDASSIDEVLPDVPEALIAFTATPYVFGEALVLALDSAGGEDAIDDAFRNPPLSALQLMNPLRFLDDTKPQVVVLPDPGEGVEVPEDAEDVFGAIDLFLMLAQRIDPLAALSAADTWAGGTFRLEEESGADGPGRVCVSLGFVAEPDAGPEPMHAVLSQWRDAMPGEAGVSVELAGEQLNLRSCDPGPDVVVLEGDRLMTALGVPATRSFLTAGILTGADAGTADCVATAVWAQLSWEHFLDESGAFWEGEEFGSLVLESATSCRG